MSKRLIIVGSDGSEVARRVVRGRAETPAGATPA